MNHDEGTVPIRFRSPHCDVRLSAPNEAGGRSKPCPACGRIVTVPARSNSLAGWVWVALVVLVLAFILCGGKVGVFFVPDRDGVYSQRFFRP
jgi:hypothetical protein